MGVRLQPDVPERVYAWMALNCPVSENEKANLAEYWIMQGIKYELQQQREATEQRLDLDDELAEALERAKEMDDIEM